MQKQSIKLLDKNKANLLKLATRSKVMCHLLQRAKLFVTDNLLSPIAKKYICTLRCLSTYVSSHVAKCKAVNF